MRPLKAVIRTFETSIFVGKRGGFIAFLVNSYKGFLKPENCGASVLISLQLAVQKRVIYAKRGEKKRTSLYSK